MKSSIADPSFKNSGLLATSHSRPVRSLNRAAIRLHVRTGTVLLVTTIASGRRWGAMLSTAVHNCDKSAARLPDRLRIILWIQLSLGSSDGQEHDFRELHRRRQIGREVQAVDRQILFDQLRQTGLVDWNLASA